MRSAAPSVWLLGLSVLLWSCVACSERGPSDEELLERFAKDVTGKVDAGLITRSVGYLDLARYPLDVRVPRLSGVYTEQRSAELLETYRKGLKRHFWGDTLDLRNTKIDIEGDRATVKLSIRCRYGGLKADVSLRKPAPGVWKVSQVHVDRTLL